MATSRTLLRALPASACCAILLGCTAPPPRADSPTEVERELVRLFEDDQDQRREILARGGGWSPTEEDMHRLLEADAKRIARVYELDAAKAIRTPASLYSAAMILQHGRETADFDRAHELAREAAERGEERARWLAAASLDRSLMSRGLPQKYGTQYRTVDGRWILHEVDPAVTDVERAEWNCPSLAEAKRHVAELNRASSP